MWLLLRPGPNIKDLSPPYPNVSCFQGCMLLPLEINKWQSLVKAAILLVGSFEITGDVFVFFMYFCSLKIDDIVWATSSCHFSWTICTWLQKMFPMGKSHTKFLCPPRCFKVEMYVGIRQPGIVINHHKLQTHKLYKAQLVLKWQIMLRISASLFHLPLSHQLQWMKPIHVQTQLLWIY